MADPRDNLRPWQPGQSGNPNGSSAKQRLTNKLLKMLDEKGLDEPFLKAGMAAALKGDFAFWKYIYERIDGPIAQAHGGLTEPTANDEDGNPIEP